MNDSAKDKAQLEQEQRSVMDKKTYASLNKISSNDYTKQKQ